MRQMKREYINDFIELARDTIQGGQVKEMDRYIQHSSITCLQHCVIVAYYSFYWNRKYHLGCDEASLVRGALLHDYFLYDWHDGDKSHRLHGFYHPGRALVNAQRDFHLNDIERDIIKKHMWPLTPALPRCREAWLVCAVDTVSCVIEVVTVIRFLRALRKKWLFGLMRVPEGC